MSTLVPLLVYNDARKAIDWLERAFGFERRLVVEGEGDRVEHAELSFGTGMLMVDSASEEAPGPAPGTRTPTRFYTIVEDVDAHAERAVAAGATLIEPPTDQAYGGRTYSCADLEGYVWGFDRYDPWRA